MANKKEMKKMKNIVIYLLTICLVAISCFSCSNTEEAEKRFPLVQELKAIEVPINEIIKLSSIYKLKDYIILRDGSENCDVFFYVYKNPDFQFLYSFAKRGQGPKEYRSPSVIGNTPDNFFSFRDYNIFTTYQLSDTASTFINSYKIPPIDRGFLLTGLNQIDDSLFLTKHQSNKWTRRELINLYTHEIIDFIPNTFNLEKKLGRDYYTTFEESIVTSNNKRFAYGYFLIDLIEFGSIQNNKIVITNRVGMKKNPTFYLYETGRQGSQYKFNVLHNTVYYSDIRCGNNYVYALYANIPMGDLKNEQASLIEVYMWDGSAIALFKLDKDISSFVVDEDMQTIYGFNIHTSEDYLYAYQFNIE